MADNRKQHTTHQRVPTLKKRDAIQGRCLCWYSWGLPLIGFAITFIFGVGLSLSNANIRSNIQNVGLGLFVL